MKFDGYLTLVDVSALELVNKFDNMVKAGTELS